MKRNHAQNSQAGVTLLMSVMILAGLTLISVAVGAFAVQQLRAARAVVVTEPAIAAAESGGEEGLWAMKRNTTITTCPTTGNSPLSNNSIINQCKSFASATFSIRGGIPFTFYLYDPNYTNGNGDTDLSSYPYAWVSVTNSSGTNQIGIAAQRLDGSTSGLSPSSSNVLPANTQVVNISPVSSGSEGRIQVTLTSSGDNTVTVNTDRGMPTFPTIDSTGCSSNTTIASCSATGQEIFSRRINITVPQ